MIMPGTTTTTTTTASRRRRRPVVKEGLAQGIDNAIHTAFELVQKAKAQLFVMEAERLQQCQLLFPPQPRPRRRRLLLPPRLRLSFHVALVGLLGKKIHDPRHSTVVPSRERVRVSERVRER